LSSHISPAPAVRRPKHAPANAGDIGLVRISIPSARTPLPPRGRRCAPARCRHHPPAS
jgi:hypothetical protein